MVVAALCAAITPATAHTQPPKFAERASTLPAPHVYDGGWEHFVGGGVAVFDCNGDHLPDFFAAGGTNPARLFINTSKPGGDISFRYGDAPLLNDELLIGVSGAYPIDIDSDGALDIAVLRTGENVLLRGLGGCRFDDATDDWGFAGGARWSTAFTATWEPGKGWPTVAIGNYVARENPEGPFGACDINQLYRGREKGDGFAPPEPLTPGFCALSMLISDWKRSGVPELRISNDRHYYVHDGYEQMFALSPLREYGDAENWPRLKLWGMGIGSQDLNGDGLPEVFLTSMADQLLQINHGNGEMKAAPYSIGTYASTPYLGDDGRPSTGWHAAFADINNDGRADLFISKGNVDQMPSNALEDPNNLLIHQEDGSFREAGEEAGIASRARGRGAAVVDLNLDGRLDIIVVNRRAPLEIWQNQTESTGNWAAITLQQHGTNPNAIGAIVELRSDLPLQTQELTIGGGHASGQAGPLHFGLGAAKEAHARVIWPGGEVGAWTELQLNQRNTLRRGAQTPNP